MEIGGLPKEGQGKGNLDSELLGEWLPLLGKMSARRCWYSGVDPGELGRALLPASGGQPFYHHPANTDILSI